MIQTSSNIGKARGEGPVAVRLKPIPPPGGELGGKGYFENPILAVVYQGPNCYKSVTKLLPKTVAP